MHDALLATCMLLQIQSTLMSDGHQDYLIMGRGTGFLVQRLQRHETIDNWQLRNLGAFVGRRLHLLDRDTLALRESRAAALASSLAAFEPLCLTADEKIFCTGMQRMCHWLQQPQYQGAFQAE